MHTGGEVCCLGVIWSMLTIGFLRNTGPHAYLVAMDSIRTRSAHRACCYVVGEIVTSSCHCAANCPNGLPIGSRSPAPSTNKRDMR